MLKSVLGGLSLLAFATVAAAQERKLPYWASLNSGEALMRAGPGKQFPAQWRYARRGLPVRVLGVYQNWRRVEDPDGAVGWMNQVLLTADRTAMIRPGAPRPLRADPSSDAPVRYLAEPGVVGALSDCAEGWCQLDVGGRRGHVLARDIWGVEPGEELD